MVDTNLTVPRAGQPGFDSRQGREFYHFTAAFKPALGPTQMEYFSLGVKCPGRETDYSPASNVEVRNAHFFIEWYLVKYHKDNFAFIYEYIKT
jgi:hypothetical protein